MPSPAARRGSRYGRSCSTGCVDPSEFLEAALRALPREDTEQNVQLVTSYLDDVFWRFLGNGARRRYAPELERTLRAGIARASSSSLKSTYFTAFRTIVTTPDGVAFLERVWRRQEKVPGLILAEPDEASMALELAVRATASRPRPSDASLRPRHRTGAATDFRRTPRDAILDEQRARFQNPDRKARFEFVMPALSADPRDADAFFASLSRCEKPAARAVGHRGVELSEPSASGRRVARAPAALARPARRDSAHGRHFLSEELDGRRPRRPQLARGGRHRARVSRRASGRRNAPPVTEGPPPACRRDLPCSLRRIILQSADDLFRAPDIVIPGTSAISHRLC